jgi:hypothetical protein
MKLLVLDPICSKHINRKYNNGEGWNRKGIPETWCIRSNRNQKHSVEELREGKDVIG